MAHRRYRDRVVTLFIASCLVFNFPLLSLFDRPTTWFGIPRLYLYLFLAWLAVIVLVHWSARVFAAAERESNRARR